MPPAYSTFVLVVLQVVTFTSPEYAASIGGIKKSRRLPHQGI